MDHPHSLATLETKETLSPAFRKRPGIHNARNQPRATKGPNDRTVTKVVSVSIALFCSVILFASTGRSTDVAYKIQLNGIDLWFDGQTGGLQQLSSAATGMMLEANDDQSGLLDVAYPISQFTPLRLASRYSHAELLPQDRGVTIKYESLGASRKNFFLPAGRVSAQITIRAAGDGRSVIFSCQISNNSAAPIPQVLFPDLWGLTPSNGVEHTELRLARGVVHPFTVPFRDPESAPPYYERVGWKVYPSALGYYVPNALRWLDFGGLQGGLSVFQREWETTDWPDVLTYRSERDPLHLRLAWQHKGSIEPGQTWQSGEFWMTPHPGGWAKGIEVFREYVEQVNPTRHLPDHIQNGLGFRTIWMTQQPETEPDKAYFRFTDIPRAARDALQYGLDELVPWFWNDCFLMPIHYLRTLGTEQELFQGMAQAKALGVNVAPFVSVHIVRDEAAAKYGVTPGREDWTYHPELIPQFRPYYAHDLEGPFIQDDNLVWQKDVEAALKEWINKGMYSLAFDQFDYKEIPGQKPGLVKVIERVRAAARAHDPQSTFASEPGTNLEWDSAILDYTWCWVDYADSGPLVAVLRSPRLNCNIDDSPLAAKRCFAENLYLNVMPSEPDGPNGTALISEKPPLAEALKNLAVLRKQFLPYFVQGHALGESVLSEVTAAFVRAYTLNNRLLVFVLNDHPGAQRVVLRSDLGLWLTKADRLHVDEFDEHGRLLNSRSEKGSRWTFETTALEAGKLVAIEIRPE
jgi:hypothetical protein